jgi:transposase
LRAGAECGQQKTSTYRNILKLERVLWTFVRVEGIEPTNNNAERPLRWAVIWRRKSFGTQIETGSQFVERILTVVTTLRQQGREVLDYLTAVCGSVYGQGMSICLVPDSS